MTFTPAAKAAAGALLTGDINPFYRENGMLYMRMDAVEFGPAPDSEVFKTPRKRISFYFDNKLMATMFIDAVSEDNSVRLTGIEGRMRVDLG
jgi:hypothetical protein